LSFADGDAKALAENDDVKQFHPGIVRRKRKVFPRRDALQAPPALAGMSPAPDSAAMDTKPELC
jgi:hypothetical protein